MKKIIFAAVGLMAVASCEMDFYRSDTMTSSQIKSDPNAAVYTTEGNYSLFKDVVAYNGSEESNNTYSRHYLLMSELRGDNVIVAKRTEDPLFNAYDYTDNPSGCYNLAYFWYIAYKIIYGANTNIESIPEGVSAVTNHILGENYFMRAIAHHHLSNLYSRPYSRGRDNLGVVLRTSTDCSTTQRATVGEVHDQIVKDLIKAAELMKDGADRGNKGYINYETARGLLTRIYLYMGQDDEVIKLAKEMLGDTPEAAATKLISGNELPDYPENVLTSSETLWSVGRIGEKDNKYVAGGQLGSMYYLGANGAGYCEMYYSDPLIELYNRHPEDLRLSAYYEPLNPTGDGKKMVHWPVDDGVSYRPNNLVRDVTENGGKYTFNLEGKTYEVKEKTVNSWPAYYIEGYATDAEDDDDIVGGTRVYLRDNVKATGIYAGNFPRYQMSKFSNSNGGPDDDCMLCSHVMIRWAEVVLNIAEAYAHKGDVENALKYVNVIRKRAGLSGEALFTQANMAAQGYTDVLDVVLDERRLELCFEGHRALDLYRNGRPINRKYAGQHEWKVWTVEELDNNFFYCIPYDEIAVTGIQQNK